MDGFAQKVYMQRTTTLSFRIAQNFLLPNFTGNTTSMLEKIEYELPRQMSDDNSIVTSGNSVSIVIITSFRLDLQELASLPCW